jgi:uncharacterized protein YdeI (YjbR/CyaY-like superfamily)
MDPRSNEQSFYPKTRDDWRHWLSINHTKKKSIWLILYNKNSNKPTISYEEAVEEALCFGWIDSKPNKRDNESHFLLISQRKPKSNWSNANRLRAEKMIKLGLMTEKGQSLIDLAKKTGTWDALDDVQKSVIPSDLKKLLDANKKAFDHFKAFPPSSKRIILEWIMNAKKPETREQRIKQTVNLAEKNIKANHYRQ